MSVGYGIGSLGAFRFARWAVEFVWARLDIRHSRLAAKERALESRYDDRLRHLEDELARTQRALTLLMNDTARRDPGNQILQQVAELLHPLEAAFKVTDNKPAPDLDALLAQAKRTGEA